MRVIVASSAGSNPDTIARVVADGLTQVRGQQVIVDDRAGDVVYKTAVPALGRDDVKKRLDDLGYLAVGNRSEEMAAYVKSENEKSAKITWKIDLPRE